MLPSENERYKSAYFQPVPQGGDTDNYWTYPTRTNAVPVVESPPGGSNSANCDYVPDTLTDIGAYTQSSIFYGEFDQGGNVFEWNEAISTRGQ